jgi:hypothetical protein
MGEHSSNEGVPVGEEEGWKVEGCCVEGWKVGKSVGDEIVPVGIDMREVVITKEWEA